MIRSNIRTIDGVEIVKPTHSTCDTIERALVIGDLVTPMHWRAYMFSPQTSEAEGSLARLKEALEYGNESEKKAAIQELTSKDYRVSHYSQDRGMPISTPSFICASLPERVFQLAGGSLDIDLFNRDKEFKHGPFEHIKLRCHSNDESSLLFKLSCNATLEVDGNIAAKALGLSDNSYSSNESRILLLDFFSGLNDLHIAQFTKRILPIFASARISLEDQSPNSWPKKANQLIDKVDSAVELLNKKYGAGIFSRLLLPHEISSNFDGSSALLKIVNSGSKQAITSTMAPEFTILLHPDHQHAHFMTYNPATRIPWIGWLFENVREKSVPIELREGSAEDLVKLCEVPYRKLLWMTDVARGLIKRGSSLTRAHSWFKREVTGNRNAR